MNVHKICILIICINVVKKKKKSYLIFEEPDRFSIVGRNNKTIPFDFIYYLIIFLRKFIKSDQHIGKILRKSFFFLKFILKML